MNTGMQVFEWHCSLFSFGKARQQTVLSLLLDVVNKYGMYQAFSERIKIEQQETLICKFLAGSRVHLLKKQYDSRRQKIRIGKINPDRFTNCRKTY